MKRRRRILWKRVLAWLFLFVLVVGGGYIYLRTGLFTIHTYEVEGAPEQYMPALQDGIRTLAEQKIFKILPGNRTISFHSSDIRTLIQETLTNTEKVSVYPKGFHTLHVSIQSYTPLFAVNDAYAITKTGVVYKEIIPLTDYPRLQVASTTQVKQETLLSLEKIIKEVSEVLFPIKSIDIDGYGDIRLYDDSRKSAIVLESDSDMDKSWSNILSAIDTDPLKSKLTDKGEHLEYIDTRFGNKVFYKFTNSASPVIIPSDNATTTNATTTVRQ